MAINKFIPVWAIAILSVSPFGIPSDTNSPASHIVPVVPILAPSTQAIAAGRGRAPAATKAIIAVSLYGLPFDIEKIYAIGKKYNLPIIEDHAQTMLAKYKNIK